MVLMLPPINKTILGCLPRGRTVPPLLTDWLEPQVFKIDNAPAVQTLPVGKRIPDPVKILPQGSKLVQFTHETGVALELNPTQCANSISQLPKFALIGIAREPLDFVLCACTLAHPVLREMQLGGLLLKPMKVVTNWDSGMCNAASHKAWCA